VCRYHGWAYGLDGRLRSARDFGTTGGFDPAEVSLTSVSVEDWRGLVFVNLDLDSTAPPLLEALGTFADECEPYPIEDLVLTHEAQHDLACNWKTYADNYLEGYHIPLLHQELNRQFDAKRYRVDLGDRYCRHSAPARDGSPNEGRWLFRWPNLAMNIYGDAMNVEVIVPTGPESCSILYRHFFTDPNAPEVTDVIEFADVVMDEDRRMVEAVQRNLASGTYRGGLLSPRHENGVLQFQNLVRAADARLGTSSTE
jgi:choline monooxygenase